MNIDMDEFYICPYDREKMIAIGEEVGNNWESIFIYECPKCHKLSYTTIKYLKSFELAFPPEKEKVQFT
jgi:hypothetical protein